MRATPAWLPYLRVADAQAATDKARAAGGKVIREPVTLGRRDRRHHRRPDRRARRRRPIARPGGAQ